MKLIKLKLDQIRSYVEQELDFPEGSLLLWGNIGSGKSTILLAIDFALFGLQRGNLTGASLLRNGADKGSVELTFKIQDKEYVIKRTLKRTKTSVAQDSGYIIRDGVKEEKTAVDLKQAILEILNYPSELLTKNKSLIYRYTVYTPQEEIKTILLGGKEERLDTLRKVFGVDKYKRVKQNSKTLVTKLKNLKKLYEGNIADLSDKIMEKEFKEKEKLDLERKFFEIKPIVDSLNQQVFQKKQEIQEIEAKKEELQAIKKKTDLARLELKHKLEQKERDQIKVKQLQEEIDSFNQENLELPEDLVEKIKLLDNTIREKETEIRNIINKISEIKARMGHSNQIKLKIESLNSCPTCLQEVGAEHKSSIFNKCHQETSLLQIDMNQYKDKQVLIDQQILNAKTERELLRKKESELNVTKIKLQQLKSRKEEFTQLNEKLSRVKGEIGTINSMILGFQVKQEALQGVEEKYPILKQELDLVQTKYNQVNVEKNRVEATLQPIISLILKLGEEIQKKTEIKSKKEYVNQVIFWLTDYFSPLMDTMERNILLKVHAEFNSLFEKWFSILIDNQTLRMTLDEEYSPKIRQNGYDIDYEFLSGGEKTAGALAYRLALNQVINNLNTGLKTKDLLILDEPTDGFSHEQLDRLRILMDEINIPQIILVSHEPQIESFVDNIVKLEKTDHRTSVI